jgi:serine/threonine protein kinase/regulator of sirC expression with transglutaminase-like and TPR domain
MNDVKATDKAIFLEALDCNGSEELMRFLDRACGSDVALRTRVEELLRAHRDAGAFLGGAGNPEVTHDEPIAEGPGTVIGSYKLLEQIGEGGFGVVFMALQQEPIRRKVALKVLKPGMDTHQVVARFEAERQALALMDHANIAKVLDAGQTSSGRPYFVMDLVKGLPITDYCDQARLTPRERLELFVPVCQAVQHAHQKGIIHRDLKPSNVLVTLQDGTPVVRVIDFGIAKALGQQLTDKSLFTGFAQMIGTPPYMSPEQAALSNVDVDTRSDIYSLGVLLYELLTGTTPLDKEHFQQAPYDEICRIIREEEPPKPSTRVSTLGAAAVTVSAQRQSDPKRLCQLFRGELDWIVMKALEKDRNRRYETASAFAADVQRYLHDEPVAACPPSAWYRFRKFARRKKGALAIAAGVFLLLAGLLGSVGWAVRDRTAREEDSERKEAQQRNEIDRAVTRALDEAAELGSQAKWPEAQSAVQRGRKLLDAARRQDFPQRLDDLEADVAMVLHLEEIYREPKRELKTALVAVMGSEETYQAPQRAELSSEEEFFWGRQQDAEFARAFREFGIDTDSLEPAEAAARITGRSIGRELAKTLDQWAALRRRARGSNDPSWKKLVEIARQADPDIWRNRCRQALLHGDRQGLEQLADSAPIHQVPPATLWLLGTDLMELGARDKAMALLRKAQQEYPDDLWINDALGWFSWSKFQPPLNDDALRFYSVTLALRPRYPGLHQAMARSWMAKGAVEEAMAEYSKAIELDPKNATAWYDRATAYAILTQWDQAIADYSRAIELEPKNAFWWTQRGRAYGELKQWDQGLGDYSKAIELEPKSVHWRHERGGAYRNLKQWRQALADYSKAIELEPKTAFCWIQRGYAYSQMGKWDQALADYSRAIELEPKTAWRVGQRLQRAGRHQDALRAYDRAVHLDPKNALQWRNRGIAHQNLGQWDQALADYAEAIELDPKDVKAWHDRGHAFAVLGQWGNAADDMDKVLDQNDTAAWMELASYRLQAGNTAGYQKACAGMLERFGQTQNPIFAHQIALSCLLTPRTAGDQKLPVQLAELGAARAPEEIWCPITRGAALYRAGQFEAAATQLRLVLKTWPENPYARPGADGGPLLTWLFLAMAQHRLGHAEDARLWLNKAVQRMDQELGEKNIGPLRQQSHVWAMCLVLRREAARVLNNRTGKVPFRS